MGWPIVLLASAAIAGAPEFKQLQEYLDLMRSTSAGFTGSIEQGEIELLKDPEQIANAMEKSGRDVGILYQDRFWVWVNDPVQFPNGNIGVYGRILSRSMLRGVPGIAVLPYFKDGRIALNCNYRHSTHSWELEMPRGFTDEGESSEEAAKRELLEETGFVADSPLLLGVIPPDTGQSSALCCVYLGNIDETILARPLESEAIASIEFFTLDELYKALREGSMLLQVHGRERKVFVRDPFLTYALFQMHLQDLL